MSATLIDPFWEMIKPVVMNDIGWNMPKASKLAAPGQIDVELADVDAIVKNNDEDEDLDNQDDPVHVEVAEKAEMDDTNNMDLDKAGEVDAQDNMDSQIQK
jgi:hypothetical protein